MNFDIKILILLILIMTGNIFAQNEIEEKVNIGEISDAKLIKPVKVIGISEDDEILFNRPTSITNNGEHIFIANSYDNNILCVDKEGKLVRKIGRSGQGPMEFFRPTNIDCNGNLLYVLEPGRLQCIDIAKKESVFSFKSIYFMEVFHLFTICVIDSVGILFNNCLMERMMEDNEKIVKVFSLEEPHNIISSLLDVIKVDNGSISMDNTVSFAKDHLNNAYINTKIENKIHKYDKNLNLQKVIVIDGEIVDKYLNEEIKLGGELKKLTTKKPLKKVILYIHVYKNHLFVLFPDNVFVKLNLFDLNDYTLYKLDTPIYDSKKIIFNKFTILGNRAYFLSTFSFFGIYELE